MLLHDTFADFNIRFLSYCLLNKLGVLDKLVKSTSIDVSDCSETGVGQTNLIWKEDCDLLGYKKGEVFQWFEEEFKERLCKVYEFRVENHSCTRQGDFAKYTDKDFRISLLYINRYVRSTDGEYNVIIQACMVREVSIQRMYEDFKVTLNEIKKQGFVHSVPYYRNDQFFNKSQVLENTDSFKVKDSRRINNKRETLLRNQGIILDYYLSKIPEEKFYFHHK